MRGSPYNKAHWDFDENRGYCEIIKDGVEYKIRNYGTDAEKKKKVRKLAKAKRDICKMSRFLMNNTFWEQDEQIKYGIQIFLYIHNPNNYRCRQNPRGTWKLSEIPDNEHQKWHQRCRPYSVFYGLNKPKNVKIKDPRLPSVGPDETRRATWRHVFLSLDNNEEDFIELLTHEIAHTAGNHVTYRDKGNHGADFHRYHNFLKEIYYLCNT